eukprot:112708_1
MSPLLQLFAFIHNINSIVATWTSFTSGSFFWADGMAVGSYGDSIYLLGSWYQPHQSTEFHYKTRTFTYLDWNGTEFVYDTLSVGACGMDQYWTQNGNNLYFIVNDHSPSQLAAYDLTTTTLTPNYATIPLDIGDRGCLASQDAYLYVIYWANLQVLNRISGQWTTADNLEEGRVSTACIVHNDYLWAFGGWGANALASNERIRTIDITQNSWQLVESLTVALFAARCVAWSDSIYILGGEDDNSNLRDIVHVMNANTGVITVLSDRLPYKSRNTAPIIVNGVLYAFNGFQDHTSQWQRAWVERSLPTVDPTSQPTPKPTPNPTKRPSLNPTVRPTTHPTQRPSLNPTKRPSSYPTRFPTIKTTTNPTKSPTEQPTANPTKSPSAQPTTPSPTQPGALACGEDDVGIYSTNELIFETTMPFTGELIFDASGCDFPITSLTAFTKLDSLLSTDDDHDGVLSLMVPPGDYKFVLIGNTPGVYLVKMRCVSNGEPTSSPTPGPTKHPAHMHPSDIPSVAPLTNTASPSDSPSKQPSISPIIQATAPPSEGQLEITSSPSLRPTHEEPMESISTEGAHDNANTQDKSHIFMGEASTLTIALNVFGTVSLCCCIGCLVFFVHAKCKGKQYEQNEKAMANIAAGVQPNISPQKDAVDVRSWIVDTVKLPQYADMFVNNGYDSMRSVMAIENAQQLNALGVTSLGHQTLILFEIKRLHKTTLGRRGHGIASKPQIRMDGQPTVTIAMSESGDSDEDSLFGVMPRTSTGQLVSSSGMEVPPPPPAMGRTVEGNHDHDGNRNAITVEGHDT